MAEYYPLLARAVAGMRNAPAEQRRAIYDRARQALLGQLRSMQPPVPEASIDRESTALDEAIARVEADIVAPLAPAPAAPPPAAPRPMPDAASPAPDAAPPVAAAPPPAASPSIAAAPVPEAATISPLAPVPAPLASAPPAPVAEPTPEPKVQPEQTFEKKVELKRKGLLRPKAEPAKPDRTPPQAAAAPAPVAPGTTDPGPAAVPSARVEPEASMPRSAPAVTSRPAPSRPGADALSRIVAERGPPAPVIRRPADEAETREVDGARLAPAGPPPASPLAVAPRLRMPSFDDALDAVGQDRDGDADPPVATDAAEAREEPLRPPAPRPTTRERFNPRGLILALVGLLVVAGIGYAAWRLRDKPEQLARARSAMIAAQQAEQQNTAKISNRADGGAARPPAAVAPVVSPITAPETPAAVSAQAGAPSVVAATAATDASAPTATAATPGTPAIAVAQRAAFLVDAPDEPTKVKTYTGTVVWSTENAAPGTDQPLARTVHADVEVPDAGLKLAVVFQKNFEAQFPASHTLELHFALGTSNVLGPIKQITVPQMRKDDSPTGDPLIGLPVTITDNYFLVGLSRGDATARNLDLIKTRNWFDVPMLLTSGKVAKITFEKGATGQQAIDDVLQSWQ